MDSLKQAVDTGKEHARAAVAAAKSEWESLSVEVPKKVEDIQARVNELEKKRLPFGLSKDEFAAAKSDFEAMKANWTEADREYKSGDQIEAVEKAKNAKGMNEPIRDQLKMKKA